MKRLLMMIGAAADLTAKALAAAVSVGAMLPLSAMADAVRVYDVDDYVQDGLVAHFDAIRNAGADAAHDSSRATWKNLVAGRADINFNTQNGVWTADGKGFYVDNNCAAYITETLDLGTNFTIQLATTVDLSEQRYGNNVYISYFNTQSSGANQNLNGMWTADSSSAPSRLLYGNFNHYNAVKGDVRPYIASWEGKYATKILACDETGNHAYFFEGDTLPTATGAANGRLDFTVKEPANLPAAATYSLGGYSNHTSNGSLCKGTFHSLRIYTKALNTAALQHNRMVDEARFRGESLQDTASVNVILASDTAAGDCADGWIGSYIVAGAHTFTAPSFAESALGAGFVCKGYKVETWNGSAWGEAETHAGERSYTYDSSSGAKVRVTWLWAEASRVYDVDDYVQDGLVAHFDAIRNAGADEPHDNSATTWANLVDAANYADFTLRDGSASAGWTDTAYQFTNNCMASTISAIDLGTNFTVQIAVTADASKQTSGNRAYHAWFNDNPKNDYGFWTQSNGDTITGNFNKLKTAPSGNVRPAISSWGGEYVTWMLDGANSLCYTFETDTIPEGTSLTVVSTYPDARKYCWGGELSNGTTLQSFVVADYHNVRMYNRPLTEDEIKHNRVVDEARYRSAVTKGMGNDDVNIIVAGADATLSSEKYCASGEFTSIMPETVVTAKGAFRRYGYVVETWDGTAWSGAVTNLSGSCTIAAGSAKTRITWLWKDILRTYDVDDYVQDGLVAHFDAIRNAGADEAHDPDATTWKNLVPGRADAAFNTQNGVWNENGFYVDNNCAAYITETLDLGTNFTIQLATTVDLSEQRTGKNIYISYFNTQSSGASCNLNGMWTDNRSSSLTTLVGNFNNYKNKNQSGDVRPNINPWGGEYATKMLACDGASNYAYFFEGDTLPTATGATKKNITIVENLPAAATYSLGGYSDHTANGSLCKGTFHSLRIYTNALDNAALQLNRKIDDARFREGRCDVTIVNGAIGETGTNGESSFADGGYNMGDGESWTLTAQRVVVGNATYMPKLLVEDYVNGAWVARTDKPQWADSFTASASTLGGNHIRLTWTWEKRRGLIISFH